MIRLSIIILLGLLSSGISAQLLTMEDASDYLSQYFNKELSGLENIFGGDKSIGISINENKNIIIRYEWSNNEDVLFPNYWDTDIAYNEIEIEVSEVESLDIKKLSDKSALTISCIDGTKNCVKLNTEALLWNYSSGFSDRPQAINHYDYVHLLYSSNKETLQVMNNGIHYLLYELLRDEIAVNKENPFHEHSATKTQNTTEVVQLYSSGGVSILKANISGEEREVILDSGASDVSIPNELEEALLAKGVISEDNYVEEGLYTIADGSVVLSKRFIAPYIIVDGIVAKNVLCSVNQSEDIILLGKEFLDRFKSWKIDNELNQLILEY